MLRNGTHRSMYQGEEVRLRSGSQARERKHLALCINNQEEVKRYHRYCNHSGGQAIQKVERSCPCKSEDVDDNSPRHRDQQQRLEIKAIVIQRAWRASISRRESWQVQDKNCTSHLWGETAPSENLQDPVMTANISPDQLKSLQSGYKHVNDEGFQLQSNHLTMDLDNNISINLPPENKVLIIQRAWRDFLQRQEVEKRSPSPPSLSSSDKMSMSISMMTLSDGSTPVEGAIDMRKAELQCVLDESPAVECSQAALDTIYCPPQKSPSSRDEEDLKSPGKSEKWTSEESRKGSDTNSDEDDDQQRGKSPALTSESVPQGKKKHGEEVDKEKSTVHRKIRWNEAERSAVHKHLANFMEERRIPRKEHCMQCIEKEKALARRTWWDVKNFVSNTIFRLNHRSV